MSKFIKELYLEFTKSPRKNCFLILENYHPRCNKKAKDCQCCDIIAETKILPSYTELKKRFIVMPKMAEYFTQHDIKTIYLK